MGATVLRSENRSFKGSDFSYNANEDFSGGVERQILEIKEMPP